nr:hypothetical protein [Tanacetum cinerariifolium]
YRDTIILNKYGAILPIELTTKDIRNTKAYKEYYSCATGEAAPKPKVSARKKKGGSASSTTPPTHIATPTPTTIVVAAPRLSAAAKEETREQEEESFDPIPRTPKDGEDDGNGEEDQGLRNSEEERMLEEEEADELYRDVDINQGRGLQVSQDIEDSHVTLTPTHSDGQQESSSTMESIFMTGSSTVTPIPSPKSTMTPSTMKTTTTASQPPIPPTPIPNRVKSLEVNFSNIPGIVHITSKCQRPSERQCKYRQTGSKIPFKE